MHRLKTIRGKILIGIVLITIVVEILINFFIWKVFEDNLKNHISNDMDKIKSITLSEISKNYNLESTIKNNKGLVLPILNNINKQYDSYISIDYNVNENIAYTGVLLNERDKRNIILESNEKASLLYINSEEGDFFASYTYPMYDESNYIGTLVLQKIYLNEYSNNVLIMIKIILVQAVIYILMMVIINIWLKKTMRSLKVLAKGINNLGDGDFTNRLEVKGNDEVSILVHHFNSMKERIAVQIQQLKDEKKKVEQLEKSTKEFFNFATHEMRTPLTAVSGYTQLLQQNTLNEKETQRAYKRVAIEAERLNKMVENMLLLAKSKEKLLYEPQSWPTNFDVKKLLIDVIEGFGFAQEKGKIHLQLSEGQATVFGVEEDITKIFVNLIDNAIKYSEDGKIHVKCEYKDKAVITIENKCGQIPKNIKDNLFEPFTKYNYGNNTQASSGLGLLICRELMNKNKGNIDYIIDKGKICFKVELYK